MREFFIEYRLFILTIAAVFFVMTVLDIIYKTVRYKIKQKKEFYKKNYGDGDIIYAGLDSGLLSYYIGDICLIGKPDLVMKDRKTKEVSVIDLKSGKAPAEMSSYHTFQLAAYFLMVEKNFSVPVKKGIIRYLDDGNKEHAIENTDELKEKLLHRVHAIAAAKSEIEKGNNPQLVRNHNVQHRCDVCEFRSECSQAL